MIRSSSSRATMSLSRIIEAMCAPTFRTAQSARSLPRSLWIPLRPSIATQSKDKGSPWRRDRPRAYGRTACRNVASRKTGGAKVFSSALSSRSTLPLRSDILISLIVIPGRRTTSWLISPGACRTDRLRWLSGANWTSPSFNRQHSVPGREAKMTSIGTISAPGSADNMCVMQILHRMCEICFAQKSGASRVGIGSVSSG